MEPTLCSSEDGKWIDTAARRLNTTGWCVLQAASSSSSSSSSLVPPALCEQCAELSVTRLNRLLAYASRTIDTVSYQFESRQVCQRGFCTKRYDLDMGSPTSVGEAEAAAAASAAAAATGHNDADFELHAWADALGSAECNADEASAWSALRAAVDPWARPVVLASERLRRQEEARRSGSGDGRLRRRRLRGIMRGMKCAQSGGGRSLRLRWCALPSRSHYSPSRMANAAIAACVGPLPWCCRAAEHIMNAAGGACRRCK